VHSSKYHHQVHDDFIFILSLNISSPVKNLFFTAQRLLAYANKAQVLNHHDLYNSMLGITMAIV
jgi:hypothetical protein